MQTISAIKVAQTLLKNPLASAKCIVDATAGNGNDTLYLAQNSPADAVVYAFDIQEAALRETKHKTAEFEWKINCILDSHAHVERHVAKPIDIAVFNLGYLPGGSHAITTSAETTLAAIEKIIAAASLNGIIAVIAYPGHEAGSEEYRRLAAFLENLPMKNFTVGLYKMINHSEKSPVLYIVERVRI